MRRVLLAVVALVVVGLVVAQIVVPRIVGGRVERRLEERGGTAVVKVSAWPVATLAFGRGGTIEIAGHDLAYELNGSQGRRPLERLDRFEHVRIDLKDLDAGSVRLSTFSVRRDGRGGPYTVSMRGRTTPGELAGELGNATGGTLGGLIGSFASGALSDRSAMEVPLRLDAQVDSREGIPDVAAADATVAGVPAGPLTVTVLRSVLGRL